MRILFILERSAFYLGVFAYVLFGNLHHSLVQWFMILTCIGWNSWDMWKRPNEARTKMRLGIYLETLLIALSAGVLTDTRILFLLLSPLARACIHLGFFDALASLCFDLLIVSLFSYSNHFTSQLAWMQMAMILIVGMYTIVLGKLIRNRSQIRILTGIMALDAEQRIRDEERIELANELHDTMGQYWTAIIRALDVTLLVDEKTRLSFIAKAREAAMDGLTQTRLIVHNWHDGKRSIENWMEYLQESLTRLEHATGVTIQVVADSIDWNQFSEPRKTAEAISRITIESVNNALRHSIAQMVQIHIHKQNNCLVITVSDDGHILGTKELDDMHDGMGTKSMRTLANGIGGTLLIQPKRDKGTCVTLTIPVQRT